MRNLRNKNAERPALHSHAEHGNEKNHKTVKNIDKRAMKTIQKEKDLKKFFKWFGKERATQIAIAVMDMWKGFINSFKANCPNAQIFYDKFHG